MKNGHTTISSLEQKTFQIEKNLAVEVNIEHNPYGLSLDDCFQMALRNNKKRAFLFVSKWLGKHIPIHPKKGLFVGALLSYEYCRRKESVPVPLEKQLQINTIMNDPDKFNGNEWIFQTEKPLTFIGFAETATALGYSMFRCFPNSRFFHTTREQLEDLPSTITFEEEHSHATSHRCYIDESLLNHEDEIVLVDDELSTGKTVRNIIQSMHSQFPRKRYTVVSILDWRSKEDRERFDQLALECNCEINVISLISGTMKLVQDQPLQLTENPVHKMAKHQTLPEINWEKLSNIQYPPFELVNHFSFTTNHEKYEVPFLRETGRFGVSANDILQIDPWVTKLANNLKSKRIGNRLLCLGSGEFMYLPMLLSSKLGGGVFYQSTTRSPIHIQETDEYAVQRGCKFPAPIDQEIQHFVYNVYENCYDEIWMFYERKPKTSSVEEMYKALHYTGVKKINIYYFL